MRSLHLNENGTRMNKLTYLLTVLIFTASGLTINLQPAEAQVKTREETREERAIAKGKYQERRRKERAMEEQIDKLKTGVKFELKLDCHHGSVSKADTTDRITVNFYRGKDIVASSSKSRIDSCGPFDNDDVFEVQEKQLFFNKFTITTSGNNAFFIDELQLKGSRKFGTKTFGKDGGRGWCLSTDPSDANGAWRDYVSNCETTKTFVVHDWYKAKYDVRKLP